jgi:hypothetical protein
MDIGNPLSSEKCGEVIADSEDEIEYVKSFTGVYLLSRN